MLRRVEQESGEGRDVHLLDPAGKPIRDLLEEEAVAVGIAERREAAVRAALGVAAGQVSLRAQASPVPDLADVRAAADQLVARGLDVLDGEVDVLDRAGLHRRQSGPELDRGG